VAPNTKEALMNERYRSLPEVLLPSPLLATESKNEFERIRDAVFDEIAPRGIIERMSVADIVYLAWEIRRLRRGKTAMINTAVPHALETLLPGLLREPGEYAHQRRDEAADLAQGWFTDPASKKQILDLLKQFDLDESAIEAEAIRMRAAELKKLDRMLASLESRCNKALRQVFEYRDGFGRRLRDASNRIIEGKALALEHSGNK
jgi:hypothetical protein